MSNLSEIEKKGCPEGMHAHDGSIHCHPADKPHKPNSKSDLAHRRLGLPNTWYEQHGTPMEEYDKENGQDEEKTEEGTQEGSEGTQEPTSEESTEQTPEEPTIDPDRPLTSKVKWDAVKNFRKNNEERFQKVEKARAEFEKIKS